MEPSINPEYLKKIIKTAFIEHIEKNQNLNDITNLKKLECESNDYRIRVSIESG